MIRRLGERSSGVLLHPTCLPGPHGHGDLGPQACRFVDFLAASGQSWWQMLPVVPPGKGHSPYDATSAFAGSPALISLERLVERGLLEASQVDTDVDAALGSGPVRYRAAWAHREPRLRAAFARFEARRSLQRGFEGFRERHSTWLADYALFSALQGAQRGRPWTSWPPGLRSRRAGDLERARLALAAEVRYQEFLQFEFDRQWSALRRYAHARGVALMGDIPIFVAPNSADVWAHPELFQLQRNGRPRVVAGCPPDYFSDDGQLWGNPIYDWRALRERDYEWWLDRLRITFERFDAARIDHFIGFANYWEVAGRARSARGGRWVRGPGAHFFERVFARLGRLQLAAEDLGVVTPRVERLRDRFGLPGLKVLHFAFETGRRSESGRPHRFPVNCIVYTGTHDNDTSQGWFRQLGRKPGLRPQRELLLRYLDSDGRQIHWDLVRLAWMSAAHTAIAPLQDLLGLGSSARMNRPGTPHGNWSWRFGEGDLDSALAERLGQLTATYGRQG